ncbi:CpsB/CapC family capsule biosynthesis tyrosine phosphatase [Oceanobacillus sp. FSL W7-1293]|uniref:tyrosine-protein phosphatase n=1 Tax=Oceanobacillus sp. FSL W7-1293 TaxID=2921699 RepID=UPI0030CCB127
MIDIHTHILPGIDDGAKSEEDSIAMAKQAVEQGIHTVIATPHHYNGSYFNDKASILTNVSILNELFKNEGIPLDVLPGQETRIYGEILQGIDNDEILSLNETKFLFIEFPSASVPQYAKQMLFDIQMKGLTPIIVHPERNIELLENPNLLYDFVKNGALSQVTAGSLVGKFGKDIKKYAEQLIECNQTHFIASDAHNIKSRKFVMNEAFDSIEKKYGADFVYLFQENSQLLINNKNVNRMEPRLPKKKKFLGLF